MSKTRVNLNADQTRKLARLLVNFSSDTANAILDRFDKDTRLRIRSSMADLSRAGCCSDESSLAEFAEFLYFEPQKPAESTGPDPIQKPENLRDRRSGGPNPAQRMTFRDITCFDDTALDALLKAAPPELTVAVLTCSPESFIRRVLARLSPAEARLVQERISQTTVVNYSEMHEIHQRYCDFATYMIDNGLLSR